MIILIIVLLVGGETQAVELGAYRNYADCQLAAAGIPLETHCVRRQQM